MKVLQVGIFNDHELGGCIVFEKGLQQNDCLVERFDYRYIASVFGVDEMNKMLIEKSVNKDFIFIGRGELIKKETLKEIRRKGTTTVLWYGDPPYPFLNNLLSEIDVFFMSSGGEVLKQFSIQDKPKIAAYYFNPSDPELAAKFTYLPRGFRDIIYTGGAHNIGQRERIEVMKYLIKRSDVSFFGGAENLAPIRILQRIKCHFFPQTIKYIRSVDYIQVIKSAKIGIGVNNLQNTDKYTSDRLTHYLEFGTFFLAAYFPKAELLFEPNKEIVYFKNINDLDSKIRYYMQNIDERDLIAKAGEKKINTLYNTKNIVAMMLEIVKTGNSTKFPWVEIYKQ